MNVGLIAAFISALSWGYVYYKSEYIVERMSAISTMASFYVLGGIFFLPIFCFNIKEIGSAISYDIKDFFSLMLFVIIAETAIIYSISKLGGVGASFLEISYPIWTVIFAFMATKAFPNPKILFGGILILIGSFIISKYQEIK